MEIPKKECPSCKEMTLTIVYDAVSYDSNGEEECFDYYICDNCGMI